MTDVVGRKRLGKEVMSRPEPEVCEAEGLGKVKGMKRSVTDDDCAGQRARRPIE